jgi:sugar phosphate isomerase/epimerase
MIPSPSINPSVLTEATGGWPLGELAAMGYRGLELTPGDLRGGTVRHLARELNLPVVCINAVPSLTPYLTGSLNDAVAWRRRQTIDWLSEALSLMDQDGIPFMVVAPGRLAENYQTKEEARDLLVDALKELASGRKSEVLLESMPFRPFAFSTEIRAIIQDVGLPNVRAALDIGHAMLCGEDPREAAEALGSALQYVQIRDVDIRPGRPLLDRHLPLGSGSADIPKLKGLVARLPWTMCISAPWSPLQEARRSLESMTQRSRT